MLRKRMMLSFAVLSVLLAMILVISGCGDDDDDDDVDEAEDLVKDGWSLFASKDYSGAAGKFDEALASKDIAPVVSADAYVGMGWSSGKMANIPEAIANFQSALSQDSQNADAHAGIALAYLANDQYDDAITSANQALSIDSNYQFTWTGITSYDLRLVLAESYYYKGNFENAQKELAKFDPEVEDLDPDSEGYAVMLLEALDAASGG